MITHISNVDVPFDIMRPILIETTDSLPTLKGFKLVSKGFKAIVENPTFLHSLLVKYKGTSFFDKVYTKDPRKFLVLDKDITKAFKAIICKSPSKNEKILEIQKMISSIALQDLKLRVFKLSYDSTIEYFRFSKTQIKKLKKVNFDDPRNWNKCLKNMANCIAKYDFPIQINFHFPENIPYLERIECAFLNPNKKMQTLIDDYEITDIFFGEASLLLINARKGNELKSSKLQEAVLEHEEHNRLSNYQLIHEFIEGVTYIIQDNMIEFKMNVSIGNQILERLKDQNSGQKGFVDQHYNSEPYKYLFGRFFPETWPSNLVELGKENCKNSFHFWLVKIFSKSIEVVYREQENDKADVKCDLLLRKFMFDKLKDSSNGLKTFIEENCKGYVLSLYRDLLFYEIWHEESLDVAQGLKIKFNNDN